MKDLLRQWWNRMWSRTEKPTKGEELLKEALAREVRVNAVAHDLEEYRKNNAIAEQLEYVFTEGLKKK